MNAMSWPLWICILNILSLNDSEIYGMFVIFSKWMFMDIQTYMRAHTHIHNITHAYIDLGKSTDTIHKRIIRHQWLSPSLSLCVYTEYAIFLFKMNNKIFLNSMTSGSVEKITQNEHWKNVITAVMFYRMEATTFSVRTEISLMFIVKNYFYSLKFCLRTKMCTHLRHRA